MKPFLKWPGGKRWLSEKLAVEIQQALTRRYFEPFVGGGAVFFKLRPPSAILSDINDELVNVYTAIKTRSKDVETNLRAIPVDAATYALVRARRRKSSIARAADFLYLNRTGWGGIYRLNSAGKFNVPFGGGDRTPAVLWQRDLLTQASEVLAAAEILRSDFEAMLNRAGAGDVVYCDPTYTVAHANNGFVRYNERNFSWSDQIRLSKASFRAAERGATVFVSNAYHGSVKALYAGATAFVHERRSLVSRDVSHRCPVREFVFVIKPPKRSRQHGQLARQVASSIGAFDPSHRVVG